MSGFYIHIPFCTSKCPYCDFYSLPGASDADQKLFLECLRREINGLKKGFRPTSIFIGGGTPTALSEDYLRELLSIISGRVDLSQIREWSCEINPGTLTPEKMELLVSSGVNRASLGAQTFHQRHLQKLGRSHNSNQSREATKLIRSAGIGNLNIDVMHSIPGETVADLRSDIEETLKLEPEHISLYNLSIESGTVFEEQLTKKQLSELPEQEQREQYYTARSLLRRAGYQHYEISNYSRPNLECRHNLLYWSGGEYIGCGPAAHSHWMGERWHNPSDLREYSEHLLRGASPAKGHERLAPRAKARETLVMSLRLLRGVERDQFREKTGFDYRELCGNSLDWLAEKGWVEEQGNTLRLAESALFISDTIFAELI